MSLLQNSNAVTTSASYDLDYSLRYSSGDTPALYKDVGADPDDGLIMTLSFWTKRGKLGSYVRIGGCKKPSVSTNLEFGFMDSSLFEFYFWDDTDTAYGVNTVAKFRDCSAWYHFTIIFNAADSTAADRIKIYVNGVRQDVVSRNSGYPPTNKVTGYTTRDFIRGAGTSIANPATPSFQYPFDGYLADFACIDGTIYAASDFGELNSVTNQWIPKDISDLTFGQNGFYLKFENSANLGNDSSGNNYDFTTVNLAATDQMIDTPQNSTGGNFCTMNPLVTTSFYEMTYAINFSEGNLKVGTNSNSHWQGYVGTMGASSGKWYWESRVLSGSVLYTQTGIVGTNTTNIFDKTSGQPYQASSAILWQSNGTTYLDGTIGTATTPTQTVGGSYTIGDILGVAVDIDGQTIQFYKNGVAESSSSSDPFPWVGQGNPAPTSNLKSATHILPAGTIYGGEVSPNNNYSTFNFGQDSSFAGAETSGSAAASDTNGNGDFYYTPPSGYLALCTDNLPAPLITLPTEKFDTALYTGTGSELSISSLAFQPDMTWIKTRQLAYNNRVFDVARGVTKELYTNKTDAEVTDAQSLKTFDSDGFTLGTSSGVNPSSSSNMVSWNWKAGGAPTVDNSAGAGNVPTAGSVKINGANSGAALAGTIPATRLSANTTSGYSIVTYTGTGSDATVGHGLSVTPQLIWVFRRTGAGYFKIISTTVGGLSFAKYFRTDDVGAAGTGNYWQNTNPTPSVFSIEGANNSTNGSGEEFVAYCWHSIEGYSKIGSWESTNTADGPFMYTGFKPAWIMMKGDMAGNYTTFTIVDNKRDTYNPADVWLTANGLCIENYSSNTSGTCISRGDIDIADFNSNGFKLRSSSGEANGGTDTYIYMAFAESPFKTSNAR